MRDGLPFDVPRTPVGSASWRFDGLRPRQARSGRLVFRVSPGLLLVGSMIALGGLVFLAIEYRSWKPLSHSGDAPPISLQGLSRAVEVVSHAIGAIVPLIVLLVGVGLMVCWFIAGRVVFDGRRQTAFRRGGKVDPLWAGGIPFRVIAAVQACAGRPPKTRPRGRTETSAESDDHAFEINLVLSSPAGERVNVITGKRPWSLRADAQRLAEFLNVPLLDHAGEARSQGLAS